MKHSVEDTLRSELMGFMNTGKYWNLRNRRRTSSLPETDQENLLGTLADMRI